MENNGFKRAGDLNDNGMSYFQRGGSLNDEQLNSRPTFTMNASELEKKIFGRVLDKTPEGYQDAIARKEAAWKTYTEIDNRISNGTATKEDWERHDEVVEIYKREAKAVENIKTYLENYSNRVNKTEVKPSSVGFERAGDLDTPVQNNSFKFEEKEETIQTPEEIRNWLKTIVSGKKMSNYGFGEGPQVIGAGQKFVGIEELQNMVKNGDNIIKAEYLDNMNMVMIEFESFSIPSKSR